MQNVQNRVAQLAKAGMSLTEGGAILAKKHLAVLTAIRADVFAIADIIEKFNRNENVVEL